MHDYNNPVCKEIVQTEKDRIIRCNNDAVFPRMLGYWYCQKHLEEYLKDHGQPMHEEYINAKKWMKDHPVIK